MKQHPHVGPAIMVAAALLAVGSLGCFATVSGPASVAYDNGYYDYESYPRYTYFGRTVYLVGDRWYYQDRGAWNWYRSEPAGLWSYRNDYYVSNGHARPPAYGAPPANRGRYGGAPAHSAPPARHAAPPAYSAPPANPGPQPGHGAPPANHGPQPGQGGPPANHGPPAYRPPAGPQRNAPPPQQQQQPNRKKRQGPGVGPDRGRP